MNHLHTTTHLVTYLVCATCTILGMQQTKKPLLLANKDCSRMLIQEDACTMSLFNTKNNKKITIDTKNREIISAQFSPDGTIFAIESRDKNDLRSYITVYTSHNADDFYRTPPYIIESFALSSKDRHLAFVCKQAIPHNPHKIFIIDTKTIKLVKYQLPAEFSSSNIKYVIAFSHDDANIILTYTEHYKEGKWSPTRSYTSLSLIPLDNLKKNEKFLTAYDRLESEKKSHYIAPSGKYIIAPHNNIQAALISLAEESKKQIFDIVHEQNKNMFCNESGNHIALSYYKKNKNHKHKTLHTVLNAEGKNVWSCTVALKASKLLLFDQEKCCYALYQTSPTELSIANVLLAKHKNIQTQAAIDYFSCSPDGERIVVHCIDGTTTLFKNMTAHRSLIDILRAKKFSDVLIHMAQ